MAHLGTLRDYRFDDQANDIRGAALYGRDNEKLGTIKDVVFDHSTAGIQYVVVDTGGWLSSKQFLVPAERISPRGEKDDEYTCALSKDQIKNFPVYDEKNLDDDKRWKDYEQSYRGAAKFEETGGVLHVAGGTNVLVPDGLPAEGPAPTTRSGEPVSGYKSPIRHREVGMMDTTPTGWGQNTENDRLTFVPDAVTGERGDVKDKEVEASSSSSTRRSAGSGASPGDVGQPVPHRYDDRLNAKLNAGDAVASDKTIVGDSIFNNEDVAGAKRQPQNVHATDRPSYGTVGGEGTRTTEGRTSGYPDAGQGQRWARFEENLRRQRPNIVGRCTICEQFQNRNREDVA
ncbi:MAG: PRC-barrel domain-containing protein [Acidobacteria bacterium]|nr:PRC-barrel domain-containing protein [Acidobacteriota bacterium]MBV9147569.1 PRC-barrel domain-containing protein [Acidobacteriota bacterium]MBV9436168.1 PRC-barrel domain-containing protein [Acidobacteriota bacterium]